MLTKNKIRYLLFAVLLPGFMVGCEKCTNLEPAENDDLMITISASDSVTSSSDPVDITVMAENIGEARVVWGHGSSSCQLEAFVAIEDGNFYLAVSSRICTDDVIEQGLDPGESRSESWSWDGQIIEDGGIKALPPGEYEVHGAAGEWLSSTFVKIEVL
jgi:hypothetical protein